MNTAMPETTRPVSPPIADHVGLDNADRVSVELSARRTGMSFQRTRMSADRTLMSIMRTALALIGFGFTIFQVFGKLREAKLIPEDSRAPGNFGTALVALGILMLTLGIVYHIRFMIGLRTERDAMTSDGLIHGQSEYPYSLTLMTALLLLLIGVLAIVSMVFNVHPFG
jgi:inner membrane protein YidH